MNDLRTNIPENIRKLMMRAGIGTQAALLRECNKATERLVNSGWRLTTNRLRTKKDTTVVGKNLIWNTMIGRAKTLSFEQVHILCDALHCTPDELFGYREIVGFSQADAMTKMQEMERNMTRMSDVLAMIGKSNTPIGEQVRKILGGSVGT